MADSKRPIVHIEVEKTRAPKPPRMVEFPDLQDAAVEVLAAATLSTVVTLPHVRSMARELIRLRAALDEISGGEGYYGAQPREYKAIARAARNG